MVRLRILFALLIAACAAPVSGLAQRVYWDPPGGRLGLGKTEPVSLVFEDCSPAENFRLPTLPGIDFGEPSESQQTSVVNFQMTTRVVLTFPARAAQKGTVVIPAFDAVTNKGKISVGEVRFEVGDAGVGSSGLAISDIVASELRPSKTTVWAGEVLDFEYFLSASSRYNVSLAGDPTWSPANLVLEPFGQPERADATVGGERRQAVRYHARGLFTQAGQLALDPVRQLVNVQTGERAVGFFSQPRIEQFTVDSTAPAMTVKPLPQPAPPGFRGAVGSFKLESTIVPRTARIGEPITWTLTLSGTGNWTSGLALPEREISADFQVVQPKTRTEMEKDRIFQGKLIEDAVLVPTTAGTYSLGPVSLAFFDTEAGQYRTQTVPAVTVQIDPVPAGFTPGANQPSSASAPPADDSGTRLPGTSTATPPPLPGNLPPVAPLPGDPLPVGTRAATPRHLPVAALIIAPLAVPLLYWIVLAVLQAVRADPTRERRHALAELRRLVRAIGANGAQPDLATLERWRTLAARVWAVRRATPTAEDLAAALASARGAARPDDWLALWREAELAMFASRATLPADWGARAGSTAGATRIRRGISWWPGRRRYWAPRLTALALALVALAQTRGEAAEALDVYRDGRFSEAREAWSTYLRRQPDDWTAHYNIALASAQLDLWAEANAHATAAVLLQPRSDLARLQLRLAATHLSGIDPAVRRLIDPVWYDRPAFWLSPGEWQNLIIGGAVVIGLAFIALISAAFMIGGNHAPVKAAGQAMLLVGVFVLLAALAALSRYGPLVDPDAAMVVQDVQLQSIPSDLAEKQKSTPIAAGTIVVVDRSFLDWDKVEARNETSGWIRRSGVVPLYFSGSADPAVRPPAPR